MPIGAHKNLQKMYGKEFYMKGGKNYFMSKMIQVGVFYTSTICVEYLSANKRFVIHLNTTSCWFETVRFEELKDKLCFLIVQFEFKQMPEHRINP